MRRSWEEGTGGKQSLAAPPPPSPPYVWVCLSVLPSDCVPPLWSSRAPGDQAQAYSTALLWPEQRASTGCLPYKPGECSWSPGSGSSPCCLDMRAGGRIAQTAWLGSGRGWGEAGEGPGREGASIPFTLPLPHQSTGQCSRKTQVRQREVSSARGILSRCEGLRFGGPGRTGALAPGPQLCLREVG